jgi:hypothetical protein
MSSQGYAVHGKNTKMSATAIYYSPEKPTGFSTLNKLSAALPKKKKSDIIASQENQEDYTIHRPVRKRLRRNPYTVSNLMYVWGCDLLDLQSLAQ